jgi:hypothetical protein
VLGNLIGTNATATAAIGNTQNGVFFSSAPGNTIGGAGSGAGNQIGIDSVGTTAAGNAQSGVFVSNAPGNTIGGTAAGAGNLITASGVHGVVVSGLVSTGSTISANSIFGNNLLGIDLDTAPADPGRTVNDAGDGDAGPNNAQNFPVITAAALGSGTLDVTFSVDSTTSNSAYDLNVEFFLADSLHGEGQTFLDAVTYTAANAGLAVVETLTIPAGVTVNIGDQVLATATDGNGNTSEFSLSHAVASPLMAASGEASPETSVMSQELGMGELLPIVDAAVERLAGLGLDASLLASIDLAIADLPGATLGMATPTSIVIDVNAAGYGWFVSPESRDKSPEPKDSDTYSGSGLSTLDARSRFDLLTVVMHELGHAAGLEDLDDPTEDDDLMYAWLEAGIRKTSLEASLAHHVFSQL